MQNISWADKVQNVSRAGFLQKVNSLDVGVGNLQNLARDGILPKRGIATNSWYYFFSLPTISLTEILVLYTYTKLGFYF